MSVAAVEGDVAPPRARRRWRRWLPWAALAVVAVVASFLYAARNTPEPGRGDALDPNGVTADGSRALAQVLGQHGVQVHRTTDTGEAAASGHPVVVVDSERLAPAALRRLAQSPNDLVLVAPDDAALNVLAPGVTTTVPDDHLGPIEAGCADPVARRAQTIGGGGRAYRSTAPASSCFNGTFLRVRSGAHRVTILGQPEILTNGHALAAGNAALALGVVGNAPDVDWLMSSPLDPLNAGAETEKTALDFLPRWVGPFVLMALLASVSLMLWRGRRLGRLVSEPLPVIVPAAETVRGRATLYRAAGAHEHVLAAHRATALRTAAGWLGLPVRSDPRAIVDGVAAAVGRPPAQIAAILLDPPDTLDARELLRRVETIDHLLDAAATATGRSPVSRTKEPS